MTRNQHRKVQASSAGICERKSGQAANKLSILGMQGQDNDQSRKNCLLVIQ